MEGETVGGEESVERCRGQKCVCVCVNTRVMRVEGGETQS